MFTLDLRSLEPIRIFFLGLDLFGRVNFRGARIPYVLSMHKASVQREDKMTTR